VYIGEEGLCCILKLEGGRIRRSWKTESEENLIPDVNYSGVYCILNIKGGRGCRI